MYYLKNIKNTIRLVCIINEHEECLEIIKIDLGA